MSSYSCKRSKHKAITTAGVVTRPTDTEFLDTALSNHRAAGRVLVSGLDVTFETRVRVAALSNGLRA